MTFNGLIYDCEIINAVPPRDGERVPGIEYCEAGTIWRIWGSR